MAREEYYEKARDWSRLVERSTKEAKIRLSGLAIGAVTLIVIYLLFAWRGHKTVFVRRTNLVRHEDVSVGNCIFSLMKGAVPFGRDMLDIIDFEIRPTNTTNPRDKTRTKFQFYYVMESVWLNEKSPNGTPAITVILDGVPQKVAFVFVRDINAAPKRGNGSVVYPFSAMGTVKADSSNVSRITNVFTTTAAPSSVTKGSTSSRSTGTSELPFEEKVVAQDLKLLCKTAPKAHEKPLWLEERRDPTQAEVEMEKLRLLCKEPVTTTAKPWSWFGRKDPEPKEKDVDMPTPDGGDNDEVLLDIPVGRLGGKEDRDEIHEASSEENSLDEQKSEVENMVAASGGIEEQRRLRGENSDCLDGVAVRPNVNGRGDTIEKIRLCKEDLTEDEAGWAESQEPPDDEEGTLRRDSEKLAEETADNKQNDDDGESQESTDSEQEEDVAASAQLKQNDSELVNVELDVFPEISESTSSEEKTNANSAQLRPDGSGEAVNEPLLVPERRSLLCREAENTDAKELSSSNVGIRLRCREVNRTPGVKPAPQETLIWSSDGESLSQKFLSLFRGKKPATRHKPKRTTESLPLGVIPDHSREELTKQPIIAAAPDQQQNTNRRKRRSLNEQTNLRNEKQFTEINARKRLHVRATDPRDETRHGSPQSTGTIRQKRIRRKIRSLKEERSRIMNELLRNDVRELNDQDQTPRRNNLAPQELGRNIRAEEFESRLMGKMLQLGPDTDDLDDPVGDMTDVLLGYLGQDVLIMPVIVPDSAKEIRFKIAVYYRWHRVSGLKAYIIITSSHGINAMESFQIRDASEPRSTVGQIGWLHLEPGKPDEPITTYEAFEPIVDSAHCQSQEN